MANKSLYHTDFAAWAFQQAALLKDRKFDQIDWDDIIEEIESMGKAEHRDLMSRMQVLISHLLKWQFQPERRSSSWTNTVREQRHKIEDACDDMPSLKGDLKSSEWLQKAWSRAVRDAVDETNLPKNTFPQQSIWTVEQILDSDFFPPVE
ncbi:MAG: DUF29 domain-containing protein [Neisseriaceae bacterium]|nr:DUF29 domain-containing protein [Neisseriaceae bacterium]